MGSVAIPSQAVLITYAQAITGNVFRRSDEKQNAQGRGQLSYPVQAEAPHEQGLN
jgi:hypothetical protein